MSNKIYQAHIPRLDKNTKSGKFTTDVIAESLGEARNKVDNKFNDRITRKDFSVYTAPIFERLQDLFKDYNILSIKSFDGGTAQLRIENNRRKNGYDIFIVKFEGFNNDKVKSVLRVKNPRKKYGWLCNGQPSTNTEYYKL